MPPYYPPSVTFEVLHKNGGRLIIDMAAAMTLNKEGCDLRCDDHPTHETIILVDGETGQLSPHPTQFCCPYFVDKVLKHLKKKQDSQSKG